MLSSGQTHCRPPLVTCVLKRPAGGRGYYRLPEPVHRRVDYFTSQVKDHFWAKSRDCLSTPRASTWRDAGPTGRAPMRQS